MKTEEFLEVLERVDPERITTVEIHSNDGNYLGISVAKDRPNWFRHHDVYGVDEVFFFGYPNGFQLGGCHRICPSNIDSVFIDEFDEYNPTHGTIVRIYLK